MMNPKERPACPKCGRRYCDKLGVFYSTIHWQCPQGHRFDQAGVGGKLKLVK